MTDPEYPVTEWIIEVIGSDNGLIVHDLIGHPDEAITFTELYYINPDTENEVIDEYVETLVDLGVLQYVGDEPFIGFTEAGKQFAVDSRMYRGSAVLKNVYQHLEMTDEVEDAFFLERPEEYLKEVLQPEFSEREWVRQSDAFDAGFDAISVDTRLIVEEWDDYAGFSARFERTTSPEVDDEWEMVIESDYEYDESELDALGRERDPFYEESEGTEYVSSQVPLESYEFDVELYLENSLSPSVSVRVLNTEKDLQPLLSAYIEPNLSYS